MLLQMLPVGSTAEAAEQQQQTQKQGRGGVAYHLPRPDGEDKFTPLLTRLSQHRTPTMLLTAGPNSKPSVALITLKL